MNPLKSIPCLLPALLLFAGCSDGQIEPAAVEKPLLVRASIDAPDGCSATWRDGDRLSLWNRTSRFFDDNVSFALQGDAAGGCFAGAVSSAGREEPHTLLALCSGRDNCGFDASYLAVRIPSVQEQREDACDLMHNAFLTASVADADLSDGTVSLSFTTPCAILKLSLDASSTDAATKRIVEASVTSERALVGNLVYNLCEERIEIPASGRAIRTSLVHRPPLSAVAPLYLVVQPADLSGSELAVSVLCDDGSVINMMLHPSAAAEAGAVTEIEVPLAELIASGDAEFDEYRTSLSDDGTANCYIVTQAGKYKFRPTKGNSSDLPEGMVRADWLWMSEADLITDVMYGKSGVTFNAGDRRGNAVIAAYDADGKIVWSWHIWLTDDPAAGGHFGASESYRLLDRNLGATSAAPFELSGYGLYYQWGRKDPFIGQNHAGNSTRFQESTAFSAITAPHVVNGGGSFTTEPNTSLGTTRAAAVGYVTEHPMTFVYNADATNGQTWWNSAFTDYENLWGTGGRKTIYDPCPPGYRVPRTEYSFGVDLTGQWDVMTETLDGGRVRYCFGYCGPAGGEVRSYYPAAGMRYGTYTSHASSGTSAEGGCTGYVGAVGHYWSNTLRPSTYQVWIMELDPGSNIFHGSRRNNGFAARGASVRCERE